MSSLVVLAHPPKNALCAQLATLAVQTLNQKGQNPQLLDLYAEGFNPVLTPQERADYYQTAFPDTSDLASVERLILVFPTWWFGPPAILKGWIDRTFLPGVAYDHADDLSALSGKLHNLRDVVILTTLGSPWWVDRIVLRRPVLRSLKWGTFKACAPQAKVRILSLYSAELVTPERYARFAGRLTKLLGTLT